MSDIMIVRSTGIFGNTGTRSSKGILRRRFRRLFRVFRPASFRFAALHSVIFGFSSIALSLLIWYSTVGLLNRQTESAISIEAQSLAEHFSQGGLVELSATIRKRIAENLDEHALYLLVDPNGNQIAGNLDSWPEVISLPHKSYSLPLERFGIKMTAVYRFYKLPDGYRLLLGRDTRTTEALRQILRNGLLSALSAMIFLGIIGGIAVRSLFRCSLAEMSAITDAISRGDLSRRVNRSGHDDEFDRLAATINDILDRVARLMDGVKQVSNAIAHDLRTPITRARVRLEDAASHARDADELRAAIERSTEDLDGIDRVFQALLRIAEIEAGARRSAFAQVDLSQLLADVAEFYDAIAEEREISLVVRLPLPIFIAGDHEMIQQAVANLLNNALKFAPPGSTVTLAAQLERVSAVVTVSDEGPGIPESDRQRAVERFYRADTARNTSGSGLGLALVSAVAELHNGLLRLEDNAPGLRAVLALPCTRRN